MSFKSRDLTVKLAGEGGGEGGNEPKPPGCGACTPTLPGCGGCTATQDNLCTDTQTTPGQTGPQGEGKQNLAGGGLALLRQQLRESLAGDAR